MPATVTLQRTTLNDGATVNAAVLNGLSAVSATVADATEATPGVVQFAAHNTPTAGRAVKADDPRLQAPGNAASLAKITETEGGLPLWAGLAWPGSEAGGDMYKATYDPSNTGRIPVAKGGTGGTTAAEARSNLGAVATDDGRLSDARQPTAHTHAYSALTGKPYQPFNVLEYGADKTGVVTGTENNTAFQNAIDAAHAAGGGVVLVPDGNYQFSAIDYARDSAALYGAHCFKLKDNVILRGESQRAVLKVKNGAYGGGAFFRVISSRDATKLSNAAIENLTIDGNRANQPGSVQCNNIYLEALLNVRVLNVWSINANGNAIMVIGATDAYAQKILIERCHIINAAYIGIQSSQFDGLRILNNDIEDCLDNAIDIYGNDGTTISHGRNYLIEGNFVRACTVGIFLETTREGITSRNRIFDCTTCGIHTNRINGAPEEQLITDNIIIGGPRSMICSGDGSAKNGLIVKGNVMKGFTVCGVQLGFGTGNHSYSIFTANFFTPNANTVDIFRTVGNQIAYVTADRNWITVTGMDVARYMNRTATTHIHVYAKNFIGLDPLATSGTETASIDGGVVENVLFKNPVLESGHEYNHAAGAYTIAVPSNFQTGLFILTGYQTGVGTTTRVYTLVKNGTTVTLSAGNIATERTSPLSGIAGNATSQIEFTIDYANTYFAWAFQRLLTDPSVT
jgi:hypothetical protein